MLDGMALVMHFGALGQKALATFGAAAGEDGTAALGSHAGAEAKLALTATLGRLVCSLAHSLIILRCFEVFIGRKRGRRAAIILQNGRMSSTVSQFFTFRMKNIR